MLDEINCRMRALIKRMHTVLPTEALITERDKLIEARTKLFDLLFRRLNIRHAHEKREIMFDLNQIGYRI